MEIWIVISAKCSELGLSDVVVLGSYVDEDDAKIFKKSKLKETMDNYRITIKKSWLQLRKVNYTIPEDVKQGYDVA